MNTNTQEQPKKDIIQSWINHDIRKYEGKKVRNINTNKVKTIRVIPPNHNLADMIKNNQFDIENELSYNTYSLTKHLYKDVNED